MLKVKTKLRESKINGIGLFADEFIPKGTMIFQEDDLTIKIKNEDLTSASEEKMEFIKHYCYFKNGIWNCSMDNDRFMNHSDDPNTYETETETFASRDIEIGEEIVCNYRSICDDFDPEKYQ